MVLPGRDVLELVLETLPLEEGEGTIPFIDLGLEGLMHAKARPHKLDPQIGVCYCDLHLCPSKCRLEKNPLNELKIITFVLPRLTVNC
jgi:hypothetical protein